MNIFDIVVIQPIFNLLMGLYSLIPGGDFGISLIIFTVLVRFAMFPLVKKQLHQTRAIKKIQPELAKIKKQTKGNKQLESMQMLELYKRHGINPFRSIGILFVQLPIFIALLNVIRIFTSHRDQIEKITYGFMEGLGPVRQLIEHPETFNEKLFGIIDLSKSAFSNGHFDILLVVLAIIAAATQYIMSKQTSPSETKQKRLRDIMKEASEGKEADQAEMNAIVMGKMMKILPLFMFFIMVSVPGTLALYYAVSNMVAVIQQSRLLKQDADEMDKIADQSVRKSEKKKKVSEREKKAKTADVMNVKRIKAKEDK